MDALRLEPWSTMTTPNFSPTPPAASSASVRASGLPRPHARLDRPRDAMLSRLTEREGAHPGEKTDEARMTIWWVGTPVPEEHFSLVRDSHRPNIGPRGKLSEL